MFRTYLQKQLPDWFSKQILDIGNKTKLLLTLLISVVLSFILTFFYEIPTKECELYICPFWGSMHDLSADINIVMESGNVIKEKKHRTLIKCKYSTDKICDTQQLGSFGEIITKGDTCGYYYDNIKSMMQNIQLESTGIIKPIRNIFYIDYRERLLPRLCYINNNKNRKDSYANSELCIKTDFSFIKYDGNKYLNFKALVAALDSSITNCAVVPRSDAFHDVKWWYPFDISQSYIHFKLAPHCSYADSISIKFTFNGAASFSEMYPNPDIISMDAVLFTDPEKIKQIIKKGLWFHATFPQMLNLQSMRVFIITTLLGFFIALAANILKNMIINLCKRRLCQHDDIT